MKFSLDEVLKPLPGPATPQEPHGVWYAQPFKYGSMRLVAYAPKIADTQTPHKQDELYFVMRGSGDFILENYRRPCAAGDALFVPAYKVHRFENFSDDFAVWAVFWGPPGGESA